MTTNVTVKTHWWPVEITTVDQYGDKPPVEDKQVVPPDSERTVYLTQSRSLTFVELPLPEVAPEA